MNEQYLSTKELSKKTGLTPRYWELRRSNGDGPPFIRVSSRAVRYQWSDVTDWLESKKINA